MLLHDHVWAVEKEDILGKHKGEKQAVYREETE